MLLLMIRFIFYFQSYRVSHNPCLNSCHNLYETLWIYEFLGIYVSRHMLTEFEGPYHHLSEQRWEFIKERKSKILKTFYFPWSMARSKAGFFVILFLLKTFFPWIVFFLLFLKTLSTAWFRAYFFVFKTFLLSINSHIRSSSRMGRSFERKKLVLSKN